MQQENKPTISGFTYVRNGINYGVPFIEAIQSILPICHELIAVVGDSVDGTRELITQINSPKIKIIDTVWDMSLREGGKIFAQQANMGLKAIAGDWAFHIQADEVIHENDLPTIEAAVHKYAQEEVVDGLLFPFLHFWGDYRHVQNSRRVHRKEIRVFKNNKQVRSYRDSQGFRIYPSLETYDSGKHKGKKLAVKYIDTPVYHYNGVKDSSAMLEKNTLDYFYGHNKEKDTRPFNYHTVPRVKEFTGTHPSIMAKRIAAYNFVFEHDLSKAVWKTKDKIIQPIEDFLGLRFGEYKNYILLK